MPSFLLERLKNFCFSLACVLLIFVSQVGFSVSMARAEEVGAIVPDGSTATAVTLSQGGHLSVMPAPKDSFGVSLNRYTRFSVPKEGVSLLNDTVQAKLLIQEVTGTSRSLLHGALTVVGPKADVVVVNPHGIEVQGGRFINTGRTVLAAARPTLTDGTLSFDPSGSVVMSGDGGEQDTGDLSVLGQTIEVSGSIKREGALDLVAGHGRMRLDPSGVIETETSDVLPPPGEIHAITMRSGALLNGGTIRILTTSKGAGVLALGTVQALEGGLTLRAHGDVTLGGHVGAKGAVRVVAQSLSTAPGGVSVQSSQSAVRLETTGGSLSLIDATLSAAGPDFSDLSSSASIEMISRADLILKGEQDKRVTLTAEAGDVIASADAAVSFSSVDLKTPGRFSLISQGAFLAHDTSVEAQTLSLTSFGKAGLFGSVFKTDYTQWITAQDIVLDDVGEKRSSLSSQKEGLILKATGGDIVLLGAFLSAGYPVPLETGGEAAVFLDALGDIVLESTSARRAEISSKEGNLVFRAGRDFYNASGFIFANGDSDIKVLGKIINQTLLDGPSALQAVHDRTGFFLWSDETHRVQGPEVRFPDVLAGILATGKVTLSAASFHNHAALVEADAIEIDTTGDIRNEGVVLGRADFRRRCIVVCWGRGSSTLSVLEAQIRARGTLTLRAGGAIEMTTAGAVSNEALLAEAARVSLSSLSMPVFWMRRAGFSGVFGLSDGVWIEGSAGSFMGSFFQGLTIESPSITAEGSQFFAQTEKKTSSPIRLLPAPSAPLPTQGWFEWILP